ncbi:MAG: hypothetical protein Ct9H300mP18_07460 [Candidatus Neomarinimicrobiota bacterium]|nr:MAG: hypothetical protein Ct9H300mP18_07460 [Candidatus Neomarinimicrobiota bacterium]
MVQISKPQNWFQTWYDDSLSLSKKYDFAISKKLGGVGIWALGYDEGYDELWNALMKKWELNQHR